MINPYKRPRPLPEMSWLLGPREVLNEDGSVTTIREATGQVWADYELIMEMLARGEGEAVCWDNRPIRWAPEKFATDWPCRVLVLSTPPDPDEAMRGLCAWRDWLGSYGAAPAGSLSGSGMSLLKATLEKPLWTNMGDVPPIKFTIGGRQELGPMGAPSVYIGDLRQWDIRAAYARTLGHLSYGGRWAKVGPGYKYKLDGQNGTMMFVNAQVEIPEMQHGPLPERPRSDRDFFLSQTMPIPYPTGRTLQGTWTWAELQRAEESGCRIKRILNGWVQVTGIDEFPFLPWWDAVEQGRLMDGFPGLLAKATGNATWGQFAIRKSQRTVVRVIGKKRVVSVIPVRGGNPSQRAPDLAEYVCAKVRAELHWGMALAGEDLVSAHTDGLWQYGDADKRRAEMYFERGWRSKEAAVNMRLISPQTIAYNRYGETETRYVVAGVRAKSSGPFFEQEWAELERQQRGRPFGFRATYPEPIPSRTSG